MSERCLKRMWYLVERVLLLRAEQAAIFVPASTARMDAAAAISQLPQS